MHTIALGIPGSDRWTRRTQLRRTGNIVAKVDLFDDLLDFPALGRPDKDLACYACRMRIGPTTSLEALHAGAACIGI